MSTAVQEFALALMRAKAIKSSSTNDFIKAHADALQMEKEQIKDAYIESGANLEDIIKEAAEDYYNKKFKIN